MSLFVESLMLAHLAAVSIDARGPVPEAERKLNTLLAQTQDQNTTREHSDYDWRSNPDSSNPSAGQQKPRKEPPPVPRCENDSDCKF